MQFHVNLQFPCLYFRDLYMHIFSRMPFNIKTVAWLLAVLLHLCDNINPSVKTDLGRIIRRNPQSSIQEAYMNKSIDEIKPGVEKDKSNPPVGQEVEDKYQYTHTVPLTASIAYHGKEPENANPVKQTGLCSVKNPPILDIANNSDSNDREICTVTISKGSINYFRTKLQVYEPNFMHFHIVFPNKQVSYTPETFYAFNWVWTYRTSSGIYPYLHWNLDYSVLSFGLLDVKTLDVDPYIFFNTSNCNLTLGTRETTELIAEQLKVLVSELSEDNRTITKYQNSYWCYLATAPKNPGSIVYFLSHYFVYPTSAINYNCCYTFYNYTQSNYVYRCMHKPVDKWVQCTTLPYVLGVILLLYFPFLLLKAAAWSPKNQTSSAKTTIRRNGRIPLLNDSQNSVNSGCSKLLNNDENWLYLDGTFPKSIMGLLASVVPDRYPIVLSRIKRFMFVLLGPSIIFVQLWLYNKTIPEQIRAIIAKSVPVGFLALLGNTTSQQRDVFVPAFGGPVSLLVSYYILGILFIVIPRDLQNIIEKGIPRLSSNISPLALSVQKIKKLSEVYVPDTFGYEHLSNLISCSFYMLFCGNFWRRVFEIQTTRVRQSFCLQSRACKFVFSLLFPLYLLVCFVEIIICILYYLIPLISIVSVIVRGTIRTIALTLKSDHCSQQNTFFRIIKNKFIVATLSATATIMFIFFVYNFCLVFIQRFFFLSLILVYSYLSVLIFPAVSFGYIFFGVVLLYYIFRLIRGFGVKYQQLLRNIIDIELQVEERSYYPAVVHGELVIRNIKPSTFSSIRINEVTLPIDQTQLHELRNRKEDKESRLVYNDSVYGIRRDLFDFVVRRHLPVHKELLKLAWHLSTICLCLLNTMSLTAGFVTGPTSEMSEVMHVIFTITIGALPRILEVAMHDSTEQILHDIELRRLEDIVNRFWLELSEQNAEATSSNIQNNHTPHELQD